MIDRELPVMATLAVVVGLVLAIWINSLAGTDGSAGDDLRPAADRPASDIAALRGTPRADRPAARRRPRPARRSATGRQPAPRVVAVPTQAPALPSGQTPAEGAPEPVTAAPPAPSPAPRPAPKIAPPPAPKSGGGGGGAGQPFDDSG